MMDAYNSMKVADLKKELKTRGLPVSGNKTELIGRLQESNVPGIAFQNLNNTSFSDLSAECSNLESEENNLFGDTLNLHATQSSLELDSSAVNNNTSDDTDIELSTISPTKPLKKRALIKPSLISETEEKVQLNRTTPVIMAPSVVTKSTVSKTKPLISMDNQSENKIVSLKTLSESEKLAIRAKRFNVPEKGNTVTSKHALVTTAPTVEVKPTTLSSTISTTDINVLKKRAERFGQNVSTVMRKIEEKERQLKRKLKFGATSMAPAISSSNEQEKKKRRAERFGLL